MSNTSNFQPNIDKGLSKKEREEYDRFINNLIEKSLITPFSDIADPIPCIWIDDKVFANIGDISFISGVPKSGKSSIIAPIIASAFIVDELKVNIPPSFLKIKTKYHDGREVVYIDTEQHESHSKKRLLRTLRLAGYDMNGLSIDNFPEKLKVYNMRKFKNYKVRKDVLFTLFEKHKNACIWIIDGITDFVGGANNEEAGNELISELMQKASENNTAIISIIHENGGNGKLRGHIGSEAERKCSGAISVSKKEGTHFISAKYLRDDSDFEPVPFRWDNELKGFSTVNDAAAVAALSDIRNTKELYKIYVECMSDSVEIRLSEMVQKIMHIKKPNFQALDVKTEQGKKEVDRLRKDAQRTVGYMEDAKYISVSGEGRNKVIRGLQIIDKVGQ